MRHDPHHHAAFETLDTHGRGQPEVSPSTRENSKESRKTIRVVLAEDQGMVLGALAALLEIEGDISVVARARNGQEALDAVLAHKPDVFITDIEMPHMSGLDVAAELRRRRTGTRVVIVTTFARAGYLRRALEAGASGYLLKDMHAEELVDAVRRVHQGLRVIHPELATEAWAEMDPLTDRERQVLRLAGEGMASGDIACELGLSDGTVRNYLSEAISKLGASNRVEAARIARTKGWL
jgi:two-component system response regulator DesR